MITVTNCGYDSYHAKPYDADHGYNLPGFLFLLIRTNAWFYQEQKKVVVPPNRVLLLSPQCYSHYGCDTPGYTDDWIHFRIDKEDLPLWNSFQFPLAQPMNPFNFHRLSQYVQQMTMVYHNPSEHKAEILDSLMRAFLYNLKDELKKLDDPSKNHKYLVSFSQLRTQIYNSPAEPWSISQAAESLCISTSYFQHLYKEFFHSSFQQDVITARIKRARYYLSHTNMSVRSLAELCGYENELHFMRQFKKTVGITPTQYRKLHERMY